MAQPAMRLPIAQPARDPSPADRPVGLNVSGPVDCATSWRSSSVLRAMVLPEFYQTTRDPPAWAARIREKMLRNDRWLWIILLAGAAVRVIGLGERSLSYDECQQYWASQGSVLLSNREITLDPPGFAWLLHAHSLVGRSETWLRLLPCLFGVLTIAAVYRLTMAVTASRSALACRNGPAEGVGQGASDEAGSIDYKPTDTQMQVLELIEKDLAAAAAAYDNLISNTIPAFNQLMNGKVAKIGS